MNCLDGGTNVTMNIPFEHPGLEVDGFALDDHVAHAADVEGVGVQPETLGVGVPAKEQRVVRVGGAHSHHTFTQNRLAKGIT